MSGGDIGNALQVRLKGDILSFPVKSGAVIYRGAPVGADSSGYAVMASDAAAMKFLGMAEEGNTAAEASSNGAVSAKVRRRGIFRMKLTGVAITDIGLRAYAETAQGAVGGNDYAVALAASSTYKNLVGTIVKLDATTHYCWVDIAPEYGVDMDITTHTALAAQDAHYMAGISNLSWDSSSTTPAPAIADMRTRVITLSATAAAELTLPAGVAANDGMELTILATGARVAPVTIKPTTDTIMGAATYLALHNRYDAIVLKYDFSATDWKVVSEWRAKTGIAETSATPTCTAAEFMRGYITNTQAVAAIDFALPASGVVPGSRCLFVNTGAAVADLPKFDIDATALIGPHCTANHCYAGNGIGDSVEIMCIADDSYVVTNVNQASRVNIAKGAGAQSITSAQAMSHCRVDLANTCVLTLPAAAAGNAGADVILSGSGASATVICAAGFAGAGGSYDTMTVLIGNACHVYSDGTNWHVIHSTAAAGT